MGTYVNTPFFSSTHARIWARCSSQSTRSRPCTQALNWALIPCVHTFFVSSLALYPQTFKCSGHWAAGMWTYQHIGYPVSEHSTIKFQCPGTSARAQSVNTLNESSMNLLLSVIFVFTCYPLTARI